MKILTGHQMRNIDRRAISHFHVPGLLLMENAGRAVVEEILEILDEEETCRIAVICGKGNNGGDGLVVARHLSYLGFLPSVFLIAERDQLEGDAAANLKMLECLPVPLTMVRDLDDWRAGAPQRNPLESFDLVVDALLGTGLTGRLRRNFQTMIKDMNECGARIVSVDLPSGLSGGSSQVKGAAVRADTTVTFAAPKIPHLLPPAETFCGDLVVAQIGIPEQAVAAEGVSLEWVDEDVLCGRLPPRSSDSHKGNYGHVLVVGGSLGKSGAVRLAAEAVLLGGAGLVTAAVPQTLRPEVAVTAAAMTLPLAETGAGGLSRRAITLLKKALEGKTVLAVGMGAGQGKETQGLLRSLVRTSAVTVVLDADGLNAFAGHEEALSGAERPLILTPHPGEMARLTGLTSGEVQADRTGICRQFAAGHDCHVVLKGYRTLVGTPEGQVFVNPTGNPGLATAGAGDALTGLLAGLLAGGLPVTDALILGVFAHGLAGDLAAESRGVSAVTVMSLMEFLPAAMRQVEELAS